MRFVDGNDCGRDGGDDVSAKKQPGEVPGVVVFNEEREGERNCLSQEIEKVSEAGGGLKGDRGQETG